MYDRSRPIYLDYNATTPHDPEVMKAMRPFLETEFGNPSSGHGYGSAAREAVAAARADVAGLIGAEPENIVFTSGGTESNNYAILGTARDLLHTRLLEICHVRLNGHPEKRLPNTLNVSFPGISSDELIAAVSDSVAMSAGSACLWNGAAELFASLPASSPQMRRSNEPLPP